MSGDLLSALAGVLGARVPDVSRPARVPAATAWRPRAPERVRANLACGHGVDVVGTPEAADCPWCRARVPVAALVVAAHPSQRPTTR
ncbi:MAG: hypothetical protein M0Z46_06505 [Actinomycetota bacterium]|nr:hypothetical protein [Actinomycetota bacterium]